MQDPAHPNYPQNLLNVVGPRNMVHSWATDKDDPTDMARWGKVGMQRIEDAGPLYPRRMETVDDEIRDRAINFMDKAKKDGKPFFVWLNPTRMHIVTHLSPKYVIRVVLTVGQPLPVYPDQRTSSDRPAGPVRAMCGHLKSSFERTIGSPAASLENAATVTIP